MINYSAIADIQWSSPRMRIKIETPKIVEVKNIGYKAGSSFTHWYVETLIEGLRTKKTDME